MVSENETTAKNKPKQGQQNSGKPNAYREADGNSLEEKDLKRTYLFGDAKMKSTDEPGMEGQGMGGQNFGKNNLTPAGNDKDNPPQNAGENNAYFKRTQPAEEHPEDENFVAKDQQGEPRKKEDELNIAGPQELPDQQKVGENQETEQHPNPQQDYQEGTADDDGDNKSDKK